MSAKPSQKSSSKSIPLSGDGKYPLVPVDRIDIVERPKDGENKLFYNPRDYSSFTPESMRELRHTIRSDGLQNPPIVRALIEDNEVVKVELIAGERRLRCILHIVKHDLPVFDENVARPKFYKPGQIVVCKGKFGKVISHKDEIVVQLFDWDDNPKGEPVSFSANDVLPAVSGAEYYAQIPCHVHRDVGDARALRLAFTENDKAKSLTTQEEITLIERLINEQDMKVGDVADMLNANMTWVSQTANFRTDLPPKAFEQLVNGRMKRHVAVDIMGYKPEDRDELFAATVEAEKVETAAKISAASDAVELAEDEEVMALADAEQAFDEGDEIAAKKAEKKAKSAALKAEKAMKKKMKAENESGQIKTRHIHKGAASSGVMPKKCKILPKDDIEDHFISALEEFLNGDCVDPVTGEEVPVEMIAIVRNTALAIMQGKRDGLFPIRQYMLDAEKWEMPEASGETDDDEEDDDDNDDEEMDGPSDEDLEALEDDFEDDEEFEEVASLAGRDKW